MVGCAAPGELGPTPDAGTGATGRGVRFRVATPDDDAECRRLLRDNPMGGDVRLSLEREPSYFAAAGIEGNEHRTIVAEEDGRLVCVGSVSSRLRYLNGRPRRVGYLGGLRLDARCRNRASIIRGGFDLFRRLHGAGGPPVYLTSIASDNRPARRLLERGLPGVPAYHFVGDFVTLVIRRQRNRSFLKPTPLARRRLREIGLRVEYGTPGVLPEVADLLNRVAAGFQFAPTWSVDDLRSHRLCPGLDAGDFRVVRSTGGAAVACAAFWDQRPVKQTVVRGYSPRLRRLRPLCNLAAAVTGRPRLPPVGGDIRHAFVSHLVSDPHRPEIVEVLINLFHGPARTRGADYLTLGFDARDGRLPHLRRAFRPREYRSRLYAVHWDEAGAALARNLDGRLMAPEVALL